MRKFNLILVAAMLLCVGSVFANSGIDENPSKTLSKQISTLLSYNRFKMPVATEMSAVVYFTVSDEKEIVVLSVLTNEEELDAFVKSRLNYIKVTGSDYQTGVTYKIPVRIKS